MYKIAGISYFSNDDPIEDIVKEMIDMERKNGNAPISADDEFLTTVISRIPKDSLVYMVNSKKTEMILPSYERHWIEFLNSIGFSAKIVHFNFEEGYKLLSNYNIESAINYRDIIGRLNNIRMLIINRFSYITNINGHNLYLTDFICERFKRVFTMSEFDKNSITLLYGPVSDITAALTITRMLHLYL